MSDSVSAEQLAFERLASQIWRDAAEHLSGEAHLLASVSPLAVRVPDSRLIWHPALRADASSRKALTRSLLGELFGAIPRGLAKLLRGGVRFEVAEQGKAGGGVLVVPSALGSVSGDGAFRTPYVELDPEREALVFGAPGTCGASATPLRVTAGELLGVAVRLKLAGLAAAHRADGSFSDRFLLVLEWLVWTTAVRFAYDLALARALEARFARGDVTRVASVHEMNSIGRTTWAVAKRHGVRGRALQHAEITPGKRWYFPLPEELAAGVSTPDELVVYDRRVAEELAPYLPGTDFGPGCSPRYAQWKGVEATPAPAGGAALFVGALARFDNDVVIAALERVAREPAAGRNPLPLRIRLHPAAELPAPRAQALARLEASGAVEVSRGAALADDLAAARVVVGMSTTVLEEALLVGRPVLQLVDDAFLTYVDLNGVPGVTRLPAAGASATALDDAAATSTDAVAAGASEIARRLGLAYPVVTHAMLLDPEPLSWNEPGATT